MRKTFLLPKDLSYCIPWYLYTLVFIYQSLNVYDALIIRLCESNFRQKSDCVLHMNPTMLPYCCWLRNRLELLIHIGKLISEIILVRRDNTVERRKIGDKARFSAMLITEHLLDDDH